MIGKNVTGGTRPGLGTGFPRGISRKLPQRAFFALATVMATVSCIERSNPFDPINSGEGRILPVREQLRPELERKAAEAGAFGPALARYDSAFRSVGLANAGIMDANIGLKGGNLQTEAYNEEIAAFDATAPVESLKLQQFYSILAYLDTCRYDDLVGSQKDLREQTIKLALFMSKANADHSPATIYPPEFSDSVMAPSVKDTLAFAALRARIDSANQAVGAYNADAFAYNRVRNDANKKIGLFNDSVNFRKSTAHNPVLVRADSIDAGTKAAKAGDTLFIGEGSYALDLRFNNSGTVENPILVRGYPGGRTVIRAPSASQTVMALSASKNIKFQDLVFRGGRGVQVVSMCTNIEFKNCVFDSSSVYGIEVTESSVNLSDCRLIGNLQGAYILGKTDGSTPVNLKNVLIARNLRTGLSLVSPTGGIFNSTISDNGGEGVNLSVPHFTFNIFNTIISGNEGVGVYRQRDTEYQDKLDVRQSDVWGNRTIDWSLAGMNAAVADSLKSRNFSVEPEFNNPEALDYSLRPGSAFFEWEHQTPPLIIGYRP